MLEEGTGRGSNGKGGGSQQGMKGGIGWDRSNRRGGEPTGIEGEGVYGV